MEHRNRVGEVGYDVLDDRPRYFVRRHCGRAPVTMLVHPSRWVAY